MRQTAKLLRMRLFRYLAKVSSIRVSGNWSGQLDIAATISGIKKKVLRMRLFRYLAKVSSIQSPWQKANDKALRMRQNTAGSG